MARAASKPKPNFANVVVETIKTIVYAALIALGVRTVAFDPFSIPSGSMIPTLLVGDFVYVSKFSYGYSRYSLPWPLSDIGWSGRLFAQMPRRGDVAVFRRPSDTSVDFIKRIIGLPGDRVQMRAGELYLNGTLVPRTREGTCIGTEESGYVFQSTRFIETLPGPLRHPICKINDSGEQNNTPEYLVPPENLFVMGDNRDNSLDSRFMATGVGFVPFENLVGRAEFIWLSVDSQAPFWQVWWWPFEIRWSRLFTGVR